MNHQTDICARRHQGVLESLTAFSHVKDSLPLMRRDVLNAVMNSGPRGLTCRELAERWETGMNAISGRFSELKKQGLIYKTGVRDGCGVYRMT